MDFLKWGRSPWGEWVLTHVSWNLFWASLYAGILFFLAHATHTNRFWHTLVISNLKHSESHAFEPSVEEWTIAFTEKVLEDSRRSLGIHHE